MRRRVAILGTPLDSANQGVRALGASLVNLCATAGDQVEVILMLGHSNNHPVPFRIGDQIRSVRVVNCRLSPRARLREHLAWITIACVLYRLLPSAMLRSALSKFTPWIAALEEVDFAGDVRGGDSFSDIYGMKRFLLGFLMPLTVLLVKKAIVHFPQTYGPYKNPLARWMARYLLKRSSIVIARDEKSRCIAQDLLGPKQDVWLSPDVAFSLEALRPERIELDPPLTGPMPHGVIGMNVNGLMYNGGYTRNNMFGLMLDYKNLLPALVEALLAESRGELWLVPHTFAPRDHVESDPEACHRLRQALPKAIGRRVRIVARAYDQYEIKGVIGQCEFFIGSRMHACIAALSQGVPCVGIAYSMKFEGVFDSVGMNGWVVDAREATEAQAITRIIELYRMRDSIREGLERNADDARRRLHEIFRRLILRAGNLGNANSIAD